MTAIADFSTSSTIPIAVIDALNSLLDAEANGLIRYMSESSPYLSRAAADIRKPLTEMVATSQQHSIELAELIESLNGSPMPPTVQREEQYLAYLSIKFLLPKLTEDKELTIQRYESVIAALTNAPQEVKALLQAHLSTHRQQLASLQHAASTGKKSR